jgi:hypothetical protein
LEQNLLVGGTDIPHAEQFIYVLLGEEADSIVEI